MFYTQQIYCQSNKTIGLNFLPLYKNQKLELNQQYVSNAQNGNISVSVFKFYVSHFQFISNGNTVFTSSKNGFLINLDNPNSLTQKLEIPTDIQFDAIRFYFGIDDKTNNEGISEGDLDPSNGMYWAWQTGYINMKIEGMYAKKQEFQFHLGGFLEPFIAFQTVELKDITNQNEINVKVNLNDFFDKINLPATNKIMSPSEKAVELSVIASQMFGL